MRYRRPAPWRLSWVSRRGVVVEAYAQLVAEGYLTSRSGGYTQVAFDGGRRYRQRPHRRRAPAPSRPPRPVVDFGYGRGNVAAFPRAAWLRSVRRVLTEAADERLGYLDGHGAVELRSALAAYLNRVRGTNADPETIVITNGYAQAVPLLLGVLAARGARTVAVEDPSASDDARPIAQALGLNVVGVPVGDDGVRVDAVAELDADLLILTPSHQWPTGGVLSPQARAAVLAWAQRTGALVLEDDYDAEYRYDRAPIGAMQGLDPRRVAYAGTASKTLAPGFRLGWLILPRELVEPFAEAKLLADRGSPILDQLTFADFLSRGEFDRHLRRMRPMYRSRRDALLTALARYLPELEPTGIAAGLHLVAWLPQDLEEATVIAAAARRRSRRRRRVALPAVAGAARRPHLWVLEPQRAGDHRRHRAPGPGRFEPALIGMAGRRGPWPDDTRQPVAQGRSFSGLRITQMCLILSPATSNANTVTVRPSCWATTPGWPLTVRSRNVSCWVLRLAILTQARATCTPPSMGRRKVVARPPPSAIAVAWGSSRPIRASMSAASQACLKSLTTRAWQAVGVAGGCDALMRRRAEEASWRHAAGVRPTISATSMKE